MPLRHHSYSRRAGREEGNGERKRRGVLQASGVVNRFAVANEQQAHGQTSSSWTDTCGKDEGIELPKSIVRGEEL